MSLKVLTAVWERSRTRGTDLLVLLAIADFTDDEGRCWPSIDTLSRKARVSDRTVQTKIRRLILLGELEVGEGKGRKGTNLYRVRLENLGRGEGPSGGVKSSGVKSSPESPGTGTTISGEKASPHPLTCQCGGSRFIDSGLDDGSVVPCPGPEVPKSVAPSQEDGTNG